MGRMQRDKGYRRENEFAHLTGGQRVPLSGAAGGQFSEDVVLPNGMKAQVKSQKDGWKTLYAALGKADLLALRADRSRWLVVLPLEKFLELVDWKSNTSS